MSSLPSPQCDKSREEFDNNQEHCNSNQECCNSNQEGCNSKREGGGDGTHPQQPVIFSKTYHYPYPANLDEALLEQCLKKLVEELLNAVNAHGGMVGHIKVLAEGRRLIWLSSTGETVQTTDRELDTPQEQQAIFFTAIVFRVPPEFEQFCKETVRRGLDLFFG